MLIPRSAFPVSRCAAKEATRYAFNGVQLKRLADGKCRVAATDGRRLMVAEWTEPKDAAGFPPVFEGNPQHKTTAEFGAIIPADAFDKIGKSIPRSSHPLICHAAVDEVGANGHVDMATTDLSSTTRLSPATINGSFPPVDDTIPNYEIVNESDSGHQNKAIICYYSAKLLREMLKAIEDAQAGDYQPQVKLTIPLAKNRPMRIDATNEADVKLVGVLMPVNPNA